MSTVNYPMFQASHPILHIHPSTHPHVFLSRIPGGDVDGGPLQVVLTQGKLEELTMELWRRCRLPLDQASC